MKRLALSLALLAVSLVGYAQTPHYDSLLTQAKAYFQQGEYLKSNACYEQLVEELDRAGQTRLSLSMREFIAINDLYLGEKAFSLEYFGPLHSETMKTYSMRSNFAGFYNLRDTALHDRRKCFEIIAENIKRNFAYLTAAERNAYWNKFGLQRGFKKAGANSIIMSLWKVDDDATRLLMTEFYKHWMSGLSKHDALEKAKQAVRTHPGKDWSDPKYWAAFILLDGVSSH